MAGENVFDSAHRSVAAFYTDLYATIFESELHVPANYPPRAFSSSFSQVCAGAQKYERVLNKCVAWLQVYLTEVEPYLPVDPFSISHPTAIQTSLYAIGWFSKFDPSGRYLGVGRYDGTAAVWDLETRSEVRMLDGHVGRVNSFECVLHHNLMLYFHSLTQTLYNICFCSWSRNSRYAMTASKDWNVIVWDLSNGCDPMQRHTTIRFDAPVLSATFHPRNRYVYIGPYTQTAV